MSDASLVQVPLGGGLDETQDDAFVPANSMRRAENVVFPDANVCVTRRGLTQASAGAPLSYANKLLKRGNEVLTTDGVSLYAYSPLRNILQSRGRVSPCLARRTLLASGNIGSLNNSPQFPVTPQGSIAEDATSGVRVRAWCDGGSVQVSTLDVKTGLLLATTTLKSKVWSSIAQIGTTILQPRAFMLGGYAYVVYWDGTLGTPGLAYASLNLANLGAGWSGSTAIGSGITIFGYWDVSLVQGGTAAALAFNSPASQLASAAVSVGLFTGATGVLTLSATTTVETTAGVTCIGVTASQTAGILVAYGVVSGSGTLTNTLRAAFLSIALAVTTGPLSVRSDSYTPTNETFGFNTYVATAPAFTAGTTSVVSATRQMKLSPALFGSGGGVGTPDRYTSATFFFPTSAPGAGWSLIGPVIGYALESKPFALPIAGSSRLYQLLQYSDGLIGPPTTYNGTGPGTSAVVAGTPSTLALIEVPTTLGGNTWVPPVPVGTFAPGFAGNSFPKTGDVAIHSIGLGASLCGFEEDTSNATSLSELQLAFDSPDIAQSVELGAWTWIAGAMPTIYDGSQTTEVGFLNPPPAPVGQGHLAGGSPLITNPQLQYCLVYAWQDDNGNVHRSAPSGILQMSATAGWDQVQLGIAPCQLTLRQAPGASAGDVGANPIRIEVYRNSLVTPAIFQLLTVLANDMTGTLTALIPFNDTLTDAVQPAGVFLYTSGGAVESDTAPNLSALCVHAGRVMGIDESGLQQWFTTSLVQAEAPRFSDAFTITWPDGPITATWSLEQRLHAATQRTVSYTIGQGPTDENSGSDWTIPEVLRPDLGVRDTRGVSVFENGALLSTMRGLYIEGRDGSFQWLGQRVQRTLAANPFVTAIVPLTGDGVVRIACKTADIPGATGLVIHWDYRNDRWSTHVFTLFAHSLPIQAGWDSAVSVNGVFWGTTLVSTSGTVATLAFSDSTTNLDFGANFVPVTLVTGWANVADKQGSTRVQRAQLLAQSVTPHGLSIVTARDYSATFDSDAGAWSDTDIAAMSLEQVRHTPTQQKCMSMSVKIVTLAPVTLPIGTGAGAMFRELLFRCRGRRGEWKRLTSGQQR